MSILDMVVLRLLAMLRPGLCERCARPSILLSDYPVILWAETGFPQSGYGVCILISGFITNGIDIPYSDSKIP